MGLRIETRTVATSDGPAVDSEADMFYVDSIGDPVLADSLDVST